MTTARTVGERLELLLTTLDPDPYAVVGSHRTEGSWRALGAHLRTARPDVVWLAYAVLDGRLPDEDQVRAAVRQIRREGPEAYLARWRGPRGALRRRPPVRVVVGTTVLDVHHTARTRLATGIQRVVRQVLQHWTDDAVLLGWDTRMTALRELTDEERHNARFGGAEPALPAHPVQVVPWRCRYLLLELAVEDDRTRRLAALAGSSGNRAAVIGYDCVPLTSGETVVTGMGAAFARNLVAVSRFEQVLPISQAAGREYDGWRRMLVGTGLPGPRVDPVLLAWEVPAAVDDAAVASAAALVPGPDGLPLLLCVGSHEPRKNHAAVLYAAERLWSEGREFALLFVGGNSWNTEHVLAEIARLSAAGRPVRTVSGISDAVLSALYQDARVLVFPSLNEGFGLPVTEALAAGTPVLTSDVGSLREIGEGHGALLVNPRDDDALVAGMRAVLFDEQVRERLLAEIAELHPRTWGAYATELAAALLPGQSPVPVSRR